METKVFRSESLRRLAKAGIAIPATLPLIDDFSIRPMPEILDRIVCLNAVAAVAHGFNKDLAAAWLGREGVFDRLTDAERLLFDSSAADMQGFKIQVEGLWALAWIAGIVDDFDFWQKCDPAFATMLPDIKTAESSSSLRSRARLREAGEIGAEADLAYCLHWALREAELNHEATPAGLIPYIVVERRRALEWVIGNEGWESVPLDT